MFLWISLNGWPCETGFSVSVKRRSGCFEKVAAYFLERDRLVSRNMTSLFLETARSLVFGWVFTLLFRESQQMGRLFSVLFERIVYYRIVWSWIWGIFPVYSFGIFRGSLAEWHKGRLERGSCCSSKSDFQGKYNWKYCLSHVMNPQWEKRRAKFI